MSPNSARTIPRIAAALLSAEALVCAAAAYASFGGTPCRADFDCHFETWGILLGAVGIPASAAIFAVIHLVFCNPERSQRRQFFLGGFIGIAAYEISAFFGALLGSSGKAQPGQEADYVLMGLASTYVVLAIASALYARSNPRARAVGA